MKYSSGAAFRQALENRLRTNYPPGSLPRLRKMIAFERLMARLDERWILKGGYALQLRTPQARTTQDIDLLVKDISPDKIAEDLVTALHQPVPDYFEFYPQQTNPLDTQPKVHRFLITARLAGRDFERFHIDIGTQDPVVESPEPLIPPDLLSFADLFPSSIICYSISQHIAEKIHAIVVTRQSPSSRVKDMVDVLLLARIQNPLSITQLRSALEQIFTARNTPMPDHFDHIPAIWRQSYNQLNSVMGLPFANYQEANQKLTEFIEPVLQDKVSGHWQPDFWQWK
jgi:hypothetical protein